MRKLFVIAAIADLFMFILFMQERMYGWSFGMLAACVCCLMGAGIISIRSAR
jgi:hypothetical protein